MRSALAQFANDADMLGTSLYGYAKNVIYQVMGVGRAGTLIDWEGDFENRVYASLYSAEQIINWRVERVNGRNVPTRIVLKESAVRSSASQASDAFVEEMVEQIRVLELVPAPALTVVGSPAPKPSFVCQVQIWQPKEAKKKSAKRRVPARGTAGSASAATASANRPRRRSAARRIADIAATGSADRKRTRFRARAIARPSCAATASANRAKIR